MTSRHGFESHHLQIIRFSQPYGCFFIIQKSIDLLAAFLYDMNSLCTISSYGRAHPWRGWGEWFDPIIVQFFIATNFWLLILHFKSLMIFVSGSIAYDTIISTVGTFDSSRRGDDNHYSYSLYAPRVIRQPWGTGHNIAYSLGLLWYKNQTILTGSVGSDFIIDERLEKHIDYTHVLKDEQTLTAWAYITNDDDNNQIIAFHPWAMSSGLHTIPDQKFDYAIVTPNDKAIMVAHVYATKQSGALVFFDPGQALGLFTKEDLSDLFGHIDYLICNDEEASTIAKLFDTTEDQLYTLCAGVIITRWAHGVSQISNLPSLRGEGLGVRYHHILLIKWSIQLVQEMHSEEQC